MRNNIYLITVLIVIVIIYLSFFRKETFIVKGLVQDRVNPLVANTNFDINKDANSNPNLVKVGIPVTEATNIRDMSATGLNQPKQYHTITGGITTTQPFADYNMSLPVFDENSMIALDNYCKSYNVNTNPFTDTNSKFSNFCGVCFNDDGIPSGVLVYEKDKEVANTNKDSLNYKYPRAMPSFGRSVCSGATSQSDDSKPPTLAINADMYTEIKGRIACKKDKTYGNNCGKCSTNDTVWSYIKNDPGETMKKLALYLVGNGIVTVKLNDIVVKAKVNDTLVNAQDIQLSSRPIISLGMNGIKEGDTFSISVTKDNNTAVNIGGALEGITASGGKYLRDLFDIVKDETTVRSNAVYAGSLLLSSYTQNPNIRVKKMVKINPPASSIQLLLRGIIPFTFIDTMQNQMGYYDCKNGPYITNAISAEILNIVDECSGQPSASGYTDECKRKKILEAGCSSAGNWWTNPDSITQTSGLDNWLSIEKAKANTNNVASIGCYGIDISTPCDNNPSSRECLAYTYASGQQ